MTILKVPLSFKLALLMHNEENYFVCAVCCKTFECSTPQEEIERQFQETFKGGNNEGELVCDDCFKMVYDSGDVGIAKPQMSHEETKQKRDNRVVAAPRN